MDEATTHGAVSAITNLLNSEAPVVALLFLAVLCLGWLLWQLWKKLEACNAKHDDCEHRVSQMALAIVDSVQGRPEEALAKARSILNQR